MSSVEPFEAEASSPGAEARRPDRRSVALVLGMAVAGALIIFSRRPDAILHPQFWAEDGSVWYAQAFDEGGLAVLFRTYSGYVHIVPRLTAAFSMLFPIGWGPAIFNVVAFLVQLAPALFLISERCASLIADRRLRVLLALLYLAIPNSYEVDVNITNAQWHLALLAALVVTSAPSRRLSWRIFDVGAILLSGLSGPFTFMLLPVCVLVFLARRERWSLVLSVTAAATAAVQAANLLAFPRTPKPLGASIPLFMKLVGGEVFLGALIGQHGYARALTWSIWPQLSFAIALGGLLFVTSVVWRVRLALRLLLLFSGLVLTASLASPTVSPTGLQWSALALPGLGARYFLIPMVAFVGLLVALLEGWRGHEVLLARGLAGVATMMLLGMVIIGIPRDWRYPAFADLHYQAYAHRVEQAAPGKVVWIPTNPRGWFMVLVKRP